MTVATITVARDLRDAGMAAAESRPGAEFDKLVIHQAIAYLASTGETFSANEVRELLPVVSPPLVGSGFLAASKAGLIERVGSTQATHEEGHARRVSTWRLASASNPDPDGEQVGKHFANANYQHAGNLAVTPEQAETIRNAHWAMEARGRGKNGIHTTAEACKVIRSLLDILAGLTGIKSDAGTLL